MTPTAKLKRMTILGLDLLAAGMVTNLVVAGAALRRLRARSLSIGAPRLLALEAAYSLEAIRARGLEHEVTCRDIDGFFEHVWSVHPAVGASGEHSPETGVGLPSLTSIAPRHTLIEGKAALWRGSCMPRLNFAMAQACLVTKLHRLIRTEGITVVRVGDPHYLGLLGMLLARPERLPLVLRINANYDSIFESTRLLAYPRLLPLRSLQKAVERSILRRADLVAAGSQNNLEFALANGARPERSTIFGYGTWIDPVHFTREPSDRTSVRDELGLGDRPVLILVSRLAAVKHPEDVLHVLVKARKQEPKMAAVFVGDGPMRDELASMAARMGIDKDVHFVGNHDQEWIARALTTATVVLSPLTGRALVEACLSGTPVVAYDVEWHSELISTGETGVLVSYRNTSQMADAVCRLSEDIALADSIGRQARIATLAKMDQAVLMEHERSVYRRLLQENSHPRRGTRRPFTPFVTQPNPRLGRAGTSAT